jgi:hypothetical protein
LREQCEGKGTQVFMPFAVIATWVPFPRAAFAALAGDDR